MAMFSFHPVKAVTTRRGRHRHHPRPASCASACCSFRNHGIVRDRERCASAIEGGWYHEQQELGFNYRLSDVHSALGRSQLQQARRASSSARNAIAARYREWLGRRRRSSSCRRPRPTGSLHAYHLFVDPPPRRRRGAPAPLRRPARARDPRPGPLRPGLPAPLLPRPLRLRAGPLPRGRALLRGLPLAAVLPGADRGRPAPGGRRGPGAGLDERPARVRDRRPPGGRRAPDLRDRRGRGQPQPRPARSPGELIDVAAEAGADAVKFQTYSGKRIYSSQDAEVQVPRGHQRQGARRSCSRRSSCRASGRASCAEYAARARHRLLLDPVRPRGGGRARRARRAGAEDRLVRDRRPAADPSGRARPAARC